MTDKEQIQHLIDKNNKLEAELIALKTKATGWFEDLKNTKAILMARNVDLKIRKEVAIDWELK